jgi:hypothetical protein
VSPNIPAITTTVENIRPRNIKTTLRSRNIKPTLQSRNSTISPINTTRKTANFSLPAINTQPSWKWNRPIGNTTPTPLLNIQLIAGVSAAAIVIFFIIGLYLYLFQRRRRVGRRYGSGDELATVHYHADRVNEVTQEQVISDESHEYDEVENIYDVRISPASSRHNFGSDDDVTDPTHVYDVISDVAAADPPPPPNDVTSGGVTQD